MTDLERIHEELSRAWDRDPWHGPSLADLLAGVSAAQAAARPIPDAHSIWELVLHLAAWTGEVERRLGGASPSLPAEGDWPEVGDPSEERWAETKEDLARRHAALLAAVEAFPPERLDMVIGESDRDAPLGTGVTYALTLRGVAEHMAYHAGQIALLKKFAA